MYTYNIWMGHRLLLQTKLRKEYPNMDIRVIDKPKYRLVYFPEDMGVHQNMLPPAGVCAIVDVARNFWQQGSLSVVLKFRINGVF